MHTTIDSKTQQCIDDCSNCYRTCLMTMTHCLAMGGKHVEAEHMSLLRECAEMCKVSESAMLQRSHFEKKICELCAEICEACAKSCGKIDPNDKQMKTCAAICRKCAESCRAM